MREQVTRASTSWIFSHCPITTCEKVAATDEFKCVAQAALIVDIKKLILLMEPC